MGLQMARQPVTTQTRCSRYVDGNAVRLFTAGYLAKLRFTTEEDGHRYYSIPSETQPGTLYSIDYDTSAGTLRCSCEAGRHNAVCKHVRLLQLRNGWAVS